MATIAEKVGFDSASYFSYVFRQKTGLSPLKYRKLEWERRNINAFWIKILPKILSAVESKISTIIINGNAIIEGCIDYEVVNIDTEFIFPDSGLTYNLHDIKANKVVICFDNDWEAQINEIRVFGREA